MADPPKRDLNTLAELGELRLIDEIILPVAKRYEQGAPLGDDCALLQVGGMLLAVSADVGPRPAIQSLQGHEHDFEAAGWHAAVATASDIATAGAKPLFMTNCIDAPPEFRIETLERFVDGLFRAYKEFGFSNAGGDIRHGPALSARITGIGLVDHTSHVGRSGGQPGDVLVQVGHCGRFMAAYLTALTQGSAALRDDQLQWLRFPRPALAEMRKLCSANLVSAASDSSDGVIGAIDNIARRSKVDFELRLDEVDLGEDILQAAERFGCDPWNIFFCWGDWSVSTVIRRDGYRAFEKLARENNYVFTRLGEIVSGGSGIRANRGGRITTLPIVRNENFLSRGFNAGIKGHLDYMLRTPLFPDQD